MQFHSRCLARSAAILLATLAPGVLSAGATGIDSAAVETAVLAANAEMVAAANRLDLETFFDRIIDSNKGLIVQNGVIFHSRDDAYASVKRGLEGVTKVDRRFKNPQVTVIAADAALLVADGELVATLSDGRAITGQFAVSLVFVQRDGQWKVLHGHYSTVGGPR